MRTDSLTLHRAGGDRLIYVFPRGLNCSRVRSLLTLLGTTSLHKPVSSIWLKLTTADSGSHTELAAFETSCTCGAAGSALSERLLKASELIPG